MPRNTLKIYGSQRNRQYRQTEGPLGSPPATFTVYGVWLSGILFGVVALVLLISSGTLSGNQAVPQGRTFSSDSDVQNNGPELQKHIQSGAQLFQAKGCSGCHANNGKSYEGIGPQLSVSNNAGNNYYIHQIVRNGLYPMPAYASSDNGSGGLYVTDSELYDLSTYVRSIRLVHTTSGY